MGGMNGIELTYVSVAVLGFLALVGSVIALLLV
jgi:hypothetical protein